MSAVAGDLPGDRVTASGSAGPALHRMVLGRWLCRLRESRGVTREEAAYTLRASDSTISRLERGRARVKLADVIALCELYGVFDHAERTALLALAREANGPGWWAPYGEIIPHWFEMFLGLEQAAELIRGYEIQFVPGLLQTRDYAMGLIRSSQGDRSDDELESFLELRMHRQQLLHRDRPPHVWMVIDEAALRRPIDGRATMFHQLQHLTDLCELPQVSVQILPFHTGGHAAVGGAITLLGLSAAGLPDVVYLEQLVTALYLEDTDEVGYYRHVLNVLTIQAARPEQTPSILREIIRDV